MSGPVASIVIPAHNETSVIMRCLEPILAAGRNQAFEITVVSNGSTDTTATVASEMLRNYDSGSVFEITEASKSAALRVGDSVSQTYPRIYLDADVHVSADVLLCLAQLLLAVPEPAVAAPRLRIDTTGCSWPLLAYHRVWMTLPYVADGIVGSGLYALNAAGGERKGQFPDVISDDAYVRGLFTRQERHTSAGEFTIFAPRTLRALIKRRARVAVGNSEVENLVHGAGSDTTCASLVRAVRCGHVTLAEVAVYGAITSAALTVARLRRWRGTDRQWSTDVTSRGAL